MNAGIANDFGKSTAGFSGSAEADAVAVFGADSDVLAMKMIVDRLYLLEALAARAVGDSLGWQNPN